nr:helix-turn-helix transcriptional regulator [Pectobacterium aquaticum]
MHKTIGYQGAFSMSFSTRILRLRKQHALTQPQMADKIGIHLTQIRRYESGEAQPSLDILKRIAITFNVSTDWLIFEEEEREPQDALKLKFEAIKQMDEEEKKSIISIIDAMILKHQAKQLLR